MNREMVYQKGRQCVQLKDENVKRECEEAIIKKFEDEKRSQINILSRKLNEYRTRVNEIKAEIQQMGGISKNSAQASMRKGMWVFVALIIPVCAEIVLVKYMIVFFELGEIFSWILAIGIVITALKCGEMYIKSYRMYRMRNEGQDEIFFLSISAITIVCIILLFIYGTKCRDQLFHITSNLRHDNSLESRVNAATRLNTSDFLIFTMLFSITVFIGGSASLHIGMSLVEGAALFLKAYRQLDRAQKKEDRIKEQIEILDFDISTEFELGKADAKLNRVNNRTQYTTSDKKKSFDSSALVSKMIMFFIGPIPLILLTVLIFFLFQNKAFGAEYLSLIDLSQSVDAKTYQGNSEFDKNLSEIEYFIRNTIKSGDILKIIGITENTFSKPNIILEAEFPKEKGAFGEVLAAEKLRVIKQLKDAKLKPEAPQTDILGALFLSSIYFNKGSTDKFLIIYSDMRNCTDTLNLEKSSKINVEDTIKKIEEMQLIPDLSGVKVYCLGVHSNNKSPAYWMSLKQFWEQYFKKANVSNINFTMERSFSYE